MTATDTQATYNKILNKLIEWGIPGIVIGALITLAGNYLLSVREAELQAEDNRHVAELSLRNEIAQDLRDYLFNIQKLNLEFGIGFTQLVQDDQPPLEQPVIQGLLSNMLEQDQLLLALQNSNLSIDTNKIEVLRDNLITIRTLLLQARDRGDLSTLWGLLGDNQQKLGQLAGELL